MAGKKITELISGSINNLPLSGVTAIIYSGTTFQHNLTHLRQTLVDSGSHHFTGSQHINGDLTITGSVKSLIVGTGSFHVDNPEILHVQNSGSYNIAHFEGDNEYYTQLNIKNTSSGNNSSTDLVLTSDNGTETNHYIDLGINSSTYTGGLVGRENDSYLLNVGKDMYIGTIGGENHPSKLFLFGQNSWERPQITVSGSGQVSFNTCSCDPGFTYQFSGSAKLQNDLDVVGSTTSSYFTGSFVGDGSQLTNLPTQTTDVSMFLSSSTFETFTSSYMSESSSFDSRILAATNEQDLSNLATTGSNTFVGNQILSGSLIFSGSIDTQTLSYAGGVGHMMMIDTNRTDTYTEIGSTDKPFKTLSSAITAANIANPTGTDPYTFVMMGCNINENIDFGGTNFNFITLATTCRTVFNGTLTIDDNPNLKQLIIRNLEFAQPVSITGDGTDEQMNDLSFYNVSFADTLNINRVNSLALWDVYSSAAINITNLNYLYVGGGQVTGDITIVADSTLPLPSNGLNPGIAVIFDLICNNLILTRGGTSTYVLQPHNTRIGLNAGNYTIPTGFTVSAQGSTFRGTWTNNGSFTLRNSSTDNAVGGTQPTYTGIIGGTFKGIGSGSFSGSFVGDGSNLTGVVGSNTISNIETITSSSYALITPVSGTLYIIID